MDHATNPSEHHMIAKAAEFSNRYVGQGAAAWERQKGLPPEGIRAAAEAGLCGMLLAEDLGGKALSKSAMARVMEELSKADMAYAFVLIVHNNLMNAIADNGTQEQKARYLPAMLSGECLGAFLLTEGQGGSDAANVTTTARRERGGWIIDGAKVWVSNAATAGLLSVYAQTDADLGSRGIACFLIEADCQGVIREVPYAMLGAHAMGVGEGAAIPAAHAKKFATQAAERGVTACMQAMGANGYKHEYPLARHLACARMANYIDGTTEIQNVVISRDLLRPFV